MKILEEKERAKQTKENAIIVIQKWVKGYYQRKEYKILKDKVRKMRKLRRFMSVGFKKIRAKFVKNLVHMMRESNRIVEKERADILKKYLNFSATTIQRVYKGYIIRKYVFPEMLEELEAEKRAVALLKGWQIRKIVSCGEVALIVRRIQDTTAFQKKIIHDPNSYNMLPTLQVNRKAEVINFINTINRLSITGDWIKTKKIQPNLLSFPPYMIPQQNQLQNMMPQIDPSIFLNQSLPGVPLNQYPMQPQFDNSTIPQNRHSVPPNINNTPVPYIDQSNQQQNTTASQPNTELPHPKTESPEQAKSPENPKTQSPPGQFNTSKEEMPLPISMQAAEENANTRLEFANDQFNSQSKQPKFKNNRPDNDEIPIGVGNSGQKVKYDFDEMVEHALELDTVEKPKKKK
jgi:hypothetical protein